MHELTSDIAAQFSALAMLEVVAVIFAVLYLVLAIRQNIWCWFCAGISSAVFVHLYWSTNLYMESALNVYYFSMAIYGWYQWSSTDLESAGLPVSAWPLKTHLVAIAVILLLAAVSGSLLFAFTEAAFPYFDSATTFAAIWATYLVARKILENWWYWLVIDVVSIFMFWARGLELTAILFVLYVGLIPLGIINWTRSYQAGRRTAVASV